MRYMESETKNIHQDLLKIKRDVELIKNILLSEGELTPYAKKHLAKARSEKAEDYTTLKDL